MLFLQVVSLSIMDVHIKKIIIIPNKTTISSLFIYLNSSAFLNHCQKIVASFEFLLNLVTTQATPWTRTQFIRRPSIPSNPGTYTHLFLI